MLLVLTNFLFLSLYIYLTTYAHYISYYGNLLIFIHSSHTIFRIAVLVLSLYMAMLTWNVCMHFIADEEGETFKSITALPCPSRCHLPVFQEIISIGQTQNTFIYTYVLLQIAGGFQNMDIKRLSAKQKRPSTKFKFPPSFFWFWRRAHGASKSVSWWNANLPG